MRRRSQKGSSLLEFTLIGIPLVFVLISIFEVARGMWVYETLAYAVKATSRFVIVKGADCAANGNTCGVTVQRIAQELQDAGIGLDPGQSGADCNSALCLTLSSPNPAATVSCALQDCLANTTPWPTLTTPADSGSERGQNITVRATIPFRSAISLFWPGAGPGMTFGVYRLGATSTEKIQF